MKHICYTLVILLLFISCNFPNFSNIEKEANVKFADQHFKTAISLIELYNIRHKEYPISLEKIDYIGDWDLLIFSSLKYTKLESGYELDVINGSADELKYPDEFWQGLGLKKSNVFK